MKNIFILQIGLAIFLNVFNIHNASSQFSRKGIPYTIHRTPEDETRSMDLPYIDNLQQKNYADSLEGSSYCTDCKNKYYGKGIDMTIDIKTEGTMEVLADSSKLWLLKISSPTAYGMQFYFDEFHLPYGATFYLYNESKTMILGAFTSDNNNIDKTKPIQFGTQWIEGSTIYLEYHEPYDPEFYGEIEVSKIIHIFRDVFLKSGPFTPGGIPSGACEINVACPDGVGWEKEINSVALILAYDPNNKLFAQCSGSVINNTNQDGRPYFLSANHCVDILPNTNPNTYFKFDYSTWLFLFNHQTLTCNADGASVSSSTSQSVYGSTLLAKDAHLSPNSDYLLLELSTSKEILSSLGVCYAGWTLNTPQAPYKGIHHPAGDVKKISSANSINNFSATHWEVDWDPNRGSIEPGSSGSPLFDNFHRIVGQSHYVKKPIGTDYCYANLLAGYGKFSTSWQLGNFAYWLDPYSTSQTSINTYCTSSCNDGVKNGNETGVDCGGNCPPCSPSGGNGSGNGPDCANIQFKINNHSTINGNIVNVCKNNIIISPFPYYSCVGQWRWKYTETELLFSDHLPCYLASPPADADCLTEPPIGLIFIGWPIFRCNCFYKKMFLAIQECDENKNLIGIEYSHWFNVGTYSSFDLNNYLPPGASIIEGNYYKIKMATTNGGWQEYNSYIRVYADNLLIQNKTITHDQFANNITIENSTVPASANIKVVAKTKIEILPNTTLESGSYYIDNFDCSQLDQFKSMKTNNPSSYTSQTLYNEKNYNYVSNPLIDKTGYNVEDSQQTKLQNETDRIHIYPNPATNKITIEFEMETNQLINADLFDFNNHKIGTIINQQSVEKGFYSIKYDCSSISNGAYFIKFTIDDENSIKKLIILKP